MDLRQGIVRRQGGILLFSITPPRLTTSSEDLQRIADRTIERLRPLDLAGLALYDIHDESSRNAADRPFPYLPTVDPADFHAQYLRGWDKPVVVYRCVGKYRQEQLRSWLREQDSGRVLTVFVGASSSDQAVVTDLPSAQSLSRETRPDLLLGGVTIPERHSGRGDEHLRLLRKQSSGCSFFVTQIVYDVNAAKNLVSDYFYACVDHGIAPVPIVFTLSVCGSMKTLAFLQWLGVNVPRWMQNALQHSADPLADSLEHCLATGRELKNFCQRLNVPFGFNVESVSIRKVEIDAAVTLAAHLREQLE